MSERKKLVIQTAQEDCANEVKPAVAQTWCVPITETKRKCLAYECNGEFLKGLRFKEMILTAMWNRDCRELKGKLVQILISDLKLFSLYHHASAILDSALV